MGNNSVALPDVIRNFPVLELPDKQVVFSQGQSCENYIVLAAGQVKVFTRSADGRELVLYRINAGEMCVLTTSCLLGGSHYPAEAVTEAAVEAYLVPRNRFSELLDSDTQFRHFVFDSFSQRLTALMAQMEQVTLDSVDQRLSRFLLQQAQNDCLQITHQDIAVNIGSAREVVSRRLKELEKQGVVRLSRGKIELLKPDVLSAQAAH